MALPGVIDGIWVAPQWLADQGFQRHLLQTEYADKLLGDLLRRLRDTGLYDKALMVVVADHGVSFRAGDRRRRPTPTNIQDVGSVPLFIKLPGQREGGIEDTAVRTIDVLPTIAEELGLELREPVDGVPVGERDADPDNEIDVPDSWELGTTTDFGTILRQRAQRLRYERSLLEAAGNEAFKMGPRPDLVGRRARATEAADGRVELHGPGPVRGRRHGFAAAADLGGRHGDRAARRQRRGDRRQRPRGGNHEGRPQPLRCARAAERAARRREPRRGLRDRRRHI